MLSARHTGIAIAGWYQRRCFSSQRCKCDERRYGLWATIRALSRLIFCIVEEADSGTVNRPCASQNDVLCVGELVILSLCITEARYRTPSGSEGMLAPLQL